jgi:hypothetical protein
VVSRVRALVVPICCSLIVTTRAAIVIIEIVTSRYGDHPKNCPMNATIFTA